MTIIERTTDETTTAPDVATTDRTIAGVRRARMLTVVVLLPGDADKDEILAAAQAGATAFMTFALAGPPPKNRLEARIGGVPAVISYDNPAD